MNHVTNIVSSICCSPQTSLFDIYRLFDNAAKNNVPSGIALVTDENGKLLGTVTEGDIRRALLKHSTLDLKAGNIMQQNPITFSEGLSIQQILEKLPEELKARNRKSSKYLSKIIFVNNAGQPARVLDYHQLWEQKVASHRHLVVVGLGYVGLTMAVVMADAGFLVTGVEVDDTRYSMLQRGESYIHEVGLPELLKEQIGRNFSVSKELPDDGDVFIISVGTPVVKMPDGKKRPIMDYLDDACEKIAGKLKRGHLVILRSTVPIGTCRRHVKAKLEEKSGLVCGVDFHLSFAPERTAEGKALKELRSLPQIIGGYNNDSLEATAAVFRDITPTIVKVESLESAEMAKLINNSFRDYVFAYSNQMARIASKFNINIAAVIKAANDGYPRDPVPLPSPGVGGPCLTKDPHIFASVAEQFDFDGDIFIKGRTINESMHEHAFEAVMQQLEATGKNPADCNILVCGLAFKGNPETGDIRNSSAVEIALLFKGKVKEVYGYDAVVVKEEIEEYGIKAVNMPAAFKDMDVVMFLNNHKSFEKINVFEMVRTMNENPIVYDGWNLFRDEDILSARPCTYMGLSYVKSTALVEA
ncbi:MAG TPA: nucleotide sugar dehydrogenase [Bacteroidia bacterium]|nr:nucleotide sugar dehydrogenase [Bacteroidia bacterium]